MQKLHVLITGGTAGIGKEIALAFVQNGARVAIFGTNSERAQQVISQIQEQVPHADIHFVQVDVSKTKDARAKAPGYPQMYSVYILHNSNTPSDFLISLIKKFFHKTTEQAIRISLDITKEGRALCEIYTRDSAETKVMHVLDFAQGQQQDVKCIMQKSESNAVKKS